MMRSLIVALSSLSVAWGAYADVCDGLEAKNLFAEETIKNNADFKNYVKSYFCQTQNNKQDYATGLGVTIPLLDTIAASIGLNFSDQSWKQFRASNCGGAESQNRQVTASDIRRKFGDSTLVNLAEVCVVHKFALDQTGLSCKYTLSDPTTPEHLRLFLAWRPTDNNQKLKIGDIHPVNARCNPVSTEIDANRSLFIPCERTDPYKAASITINASGFTCQPPAVPAAQRPAPTVKLKKPETSAEEALLRVPPECTQIMSQQLPADPKDKTRLQARQRMCLQAETVIQDYRIAKRLDEHLATCKSLYESNDAAAGGICVLQVLNRSFPYGQVPSRVVADQIFAESKRRVESIKLLLQVLPRP